MHRDPREATAIGNRGGGIGVYGSVEETIKPAVAIEWDTFFNPQRLDNGQDRIHMVQVNEDASLVELAQTVDDDNVDIRTGDDGNTVGRMWVDYNCNGNKQLEVRLNNNGSFRPTFPTLSITAALEDFFFPNGDNGIVYVGYTASIGGQADNHDIFGWEFNTGCSA
uniref:Legume lectin domain-containing protein n=1 Tax=Entomoneis paludosa TaxID=265537 RepID=A0A7S2YDW7_9STRA|mmetsp:Transcript_28833/g.60290  ORF Transcript_28833/g.60290 Transcript_28833/m.60290 type:complete len:166 (+) Transcript_28833:2-499(+)